MQSKAEKRKSSDRIFFGFAILFLIMELLKQYGLYFVEYKGTYPVWYFPFQLCSLPMYLGIWNYIHPSQAVRTFTRDFSLLGGVAALIVHDGLIHPGYPLLTFHGFLWHVLMILLAMFLAWGDRKEKKQCFLPCIPIYFVAAGIAEGINLLLHPYGDCDMFYISPYHLSSQIVFCDIDRVIGRPLGILVYLLAVLFAGYLVHLLFWIGKQLVKK